MKYSNESFTDYPDERMMQHLNIKNNFPVPALSYNQYNNSSNNKHLYDSIKIDSRFDFDDDNKFAFPTGCKLK